VVVGVRIGLLEFEDAGVEESDVAVVATAGGGWLLFIEYLLTCTPNLGMIPFCAKTLGCSYVESGWRGVEVRGCAVCWGRAIGLENDYVCPRGKFV